MCTWVYGQEKYSRIFTVSSNLEDYLNEIPDYESLKLQLYKGNDSSSIMLKGRPCFGKSLTGAFTSDFKLLPGSSHDKVILAYTRSIDNTIQLIEPLELVYNLHRLYVQLYIVFP